MNKILIVKEFCNNEVKGIVKCGEALDFLGSIDSNSAGIVFLDPPFNLNKLYCSINKKIDKKGTEEYEEWLIQLIEECTRILIDGGAMYLYHMPIWAMRIGSLLEKSLTFQHWIAISMKNGFVRGPHLYPAHYALLYFTKGTPICFRRPKIKPVLCRHCGKIIKDYGGYKKIIEEKGLNLSDFWEDLSPVRHQNKKFRSANELPVTLFDRVIEISGDEEMLYVDPFAGSGSGVLAAVRSRMCFLASDIIQENCNIVCRRLEDYIEQRNSTP